VPFPEIGLGTYRLGAETERACLDGLELGYRHIDTATQYGNEAEVGKAVRRCGLDRSEITITTKVWVEDIRSGDIAGGVGRSIDRLGQIDVLLLHGPIGDDAWIKRSWVALLDACERFGIATAGVSNYRDRHLDVLPSIPQVNQLEVSPFLPRDELVARCRADGIEVTAHSPLAKAHRMDQPVLMQVAGELESLDGQAVTPAQVLLAWSLAKGYVPLPRSRCRAHLAENLAAGAIELMPSQLSRLDALADGYATHRKHVG